LRDRRSASRHASSETDTLVTTTSFKYDVMSRRTEVKDEVNSVTTTYAHDWRGRNTSVTGPRGSTWR
jgi:hypothetical protein